MAVIYVAAFVCFVSTVRGFGITSGSGQVSQRSQKSCSLNSYDCLLEPCIFATCPQYQMAQCRNFMCGQVCLPEFWYNGAEVTTKCKAPQSGSDGTNLLSILLSADMPSTDKSNTATNANLPTTQYTNPNPSTNTKSSIANSVGSSRFPQFNANSLNPNSGSGQQTAAQPANTNTNVNSVGCPVYLVTTCNYSPCRVSACPNFRQARCVNSNCGGCFAKFYYNGQDVTSHCRQQQRPQQQLQQQQQQYQYQQRQTQQINPWMYYGFLGDGFLGMF